MVKLVSCLSKETGINTADLMRVFGEYLFKRFSALYTLDTSKDSIRLSAFSQTFEDYVHVEVRKLYPDAELPSFQCDPVRARMSATNVPILPDRSHPLQRGLIRGCLAHFGEAADIGIEDLSDGAGTAACFVIIKRDAPQ